MSYTDFKKKIDFLKIDHRHGATYIEGVLFSIFIKAAQKLDHSEFKKLVKYSQKWPAVMANLLNLIKETDEKLRDPKCDMVEFLKSMRISNFFAREIVCNQAALLIKKKSLIATISYSGLVYQSISRAVESGWLGLILVAESRPVLEGKSLAKDLSKLPVDIIYGTDCQAFSMLDDIDAVFIGADAVSSRYFINKTGTKALVSTLGQNKKVYILADSSKYYDFPKNFEIPEMPSSEVWKKHPPKIRVINKYFEKISFKENMIFVSETGTFNPDKLKNILKKGY